MNGATVTGHPERSMSKACTKKPYNTQSAALGDAEYLITQEWFRGDNVRAYRCPKCKKYHLSTTPRGGRDEWVRRK